MMLLIRWNDKRSCNNQVVGTTDSVLAIANLFENKKIKFKLGHVGGPYLSQKDVGRCADFQYWLEPQEVFSED